MSEPQISQAEMDKYFETGGKEAPAALVEAEKVETETPPPDLQEPAKPAEVAKPAETKVEPKPDGEVQVQVDGKTVPLSELLAERKERQAWQNTAAQQQQQLTEMLAMVKERSKEMTPAQEASAPDPNTDPFGYINHVLTNVQATTRELQEWRQQQTQVSQAQYQANQILGWAQQQAQAFEATTPDYSKALKFAIEREDKEYQALGISDPAARQAILQQKQAELISYARQNNLNPAQLVYNYAKEKGYKLEGVATQAKVPDLDDKVNTITRGQAAAKGVSGTSGGAPSEINNLQDLAAASGDMSDDEFAKAFDKLVPKMKGKYV